MAASSCEFLLRLPPLLGLPSLSVTGGAVALPTRLGAVVVDVESSDPKDIRWFGVNGLELSPSTQRVAFGRTLAGRQQLAVASGRNVSVVNVDVQGYGQGSGQPAHESTIGEQTALLSAHLQPVNALDWSPLNPNLLATCAEDCRFFIWDIRQRSPAQQLLAPASWTVAVRWAALDETALATGHEDTICVWDMRNSSQQMSVLAPGQNRLQSVDWSFHDRKKLLSVNGEQGRSSSWGSIKIWDLESSKKVHDSIDMENEMPGDACFLPFGPAILAAVNSTLAMVSLDRDKARARKSRVLENFPGHDAPVQAVAFARRGESDDSWRFMSLSQGKTRTLRGWKFELPAELRDTCSAAYLRRPAAPEPRGGPPVTMGPQMPLERSRTADPSSPRTSLYGSTGFEDVEAKDERLYLGSLAKQAQRLQLLDCVDGVASYRFTPPGGGEEYQLSIEVCTRNDIRLRITVSVDPTAAATRHAAAALSGNRTDVCEPDASAGKGLNYRVEWLGDFGTFDGPMAPGIVNETFGGLSLRDLLEGGDNLSSCIRCLVTMLHRRDAPPSCGGETEPLAAEAPVPRRSRNSEDHLPFPRTCGVCWSPQGDLLTFRSLQNITVPFPRRWSNIDFNRVLKNHKEKEQQRTLLHLQHDHDEHLLAASKLEIDKTVHIEPTSRLCGLAEDHWWTTSAPRFLWFPAPRETVGDVCSKNGATAEGLGRRDLAAAWRLLAFIADECAEAAPGSRLQRPPFASALVRRLARQLYEAQETLTLAMVGVLLLKMAGPEPKMENGTNVEPVARRKASDSPASARVKGVQDDARLAALWQNASSSRTWSPSIDAAFTLDLRAQLQGKPSTSRRSNRSWAEYMPEVGERLPKSADSTVSPSVTVSVPRRERAASWKTAGAGKELRILHTAAAGAADDLLPRDDGTLDCLVHSAHAHCDLLHRLGEYHASRALAKLLHRLRYHHHLPVLEASGPFQASPHDRSPRDRSLGSDSFSMPALDESGPFQEAPADTATICRVCREPARTLFTSCWSCGHGFHIKCFRKWFDTPEKRCPSIGCECQCVLLRPIS